MALEPRLGLSLNSLCSKLIRNLARLFIILIASRSVIFVPETAFGFEFVVCRSGNAQHLADTFSPSDLYPKP